MKCVTYNPICSHYGRTAKRIRGRKDGAYKCTKCGVRFHVVTDYQYYAEYGYTKEEIDFILKDEKNARKFYKPKYNETTTNMIWRININDTNGTWV